MSAKASRTQVMRLVNKLGGSLDELGANNFCIDAPPGMVWSCDDLHALVVSWHQGDGFAPEAWGDALRRLKYGIEPCPFKNCDVCEENCRLGGS